MWKLIEKDIVRDPILVMGDASKPAFVPVEFIKLPTVFKPMGAG